MSSFVAVVDPVLLVGGLGTHGKESDLIQVIVLVSGTGFQVFEVIQQRGHERLRLSETVKDGFGEGPSDKKKKHKMK